MLAERLYYGLCLVAGGMLRAATYSTVRIDDQDGQRVVRKRRRFYAPLLIRMSDLLVRMLDSGVRVLPQHEWAQREDQIYRSLYGVSVRAEADGVLVLPRLAGVTLAELLQDPTVPEPDRRRAITCATAALAEFHRSGFTHGDAMAENVLVDLDAGIARWFDFETVHDPARPLVWQRADDVRALVVTSLLRTAPDKRAGTLALIRNVYADERVTRVLIAIFATVWQRPLALHLLQARLPLEWFHEVGRLLRAGATSADLESF